MREFSYKVKGLINPVTISAKTKEAADRKAKKLKLPEFEFLKEKEKAPFFFPDFSPHRVRNKARMIEQELKYYAKKAADEALDED